MKLHTQSGNTWKSENREIQSAASAPDAILIPTEDRVKHIDCAKTDVVTRFEEIMEIFEYLIQGSPYRTVIIDTLDWMEPMLHDYICRKKGYKSLMDDSNKEVNYGRGLKYHAVEGWKMLLQNCDMPGTGKHAHRS